MAEVAETRPIMFESGDIEAVVFDLDGTLVETEHLKAESYAEIIGALTGRGSPEPEAVRLYQSIVGATDHAAGAAMIERFKLEPLLEKRPGETAVESLHRQRMDVYRASYGTPAQLLARGYTHNLQLARAAAGEGLDVAVATMSFAAEARRVIAALGLSEIVRTVVGVDDVERPKPAPDAFLLAIERLGASVDRTLIIEDSPRGARAAAASGARWLCVATEFSSEALRADGELEQEWIVWEPAALPEAVKRRISA